MSTTTMAHSALLRFPTPPKMSSRVLKEMSIIASYPVLLSLEEQMVKTPFDVAGWCLYLQQIDDLLETLQQASKQKKEE